MIQSFFAHRGLSRRAVVATLVLLIAVVVVLIETRWIRNRTTAPQRLVVQGLSTSPAIPRETKLAEEQSLEPPSAAPLAELAEYIRPKPSEERWASLHWFNNLREAQELAEQTHRMVFIWATNQPMGRC